MFTSVDAQFVDEATRYRLRFTCESCVHFDHSTELCANGYPNKDHRKCQLESASQVVFCKEFELV